MSGHDAIQLDAAFVYQQAAMTAIYQDVRQTHGEAFAAHFIGEFKDEVLRAAKTRLCGLSEAAVRTETLRLKNPDQML